MKTRMLLADVLPDRRRTIAGTVRWTASAGRKGPGKLAEYRALRNAHSIDGLPGLEPATLSRHGGGRASRGVGT